VKKVYFSFYYNIESYYYMLATNVLARIANRPAKREIKGMNFASSHPLLIDT